MSAVLSPSVTPALARTGHNARFVPAQSPMTLSISTGHVSLTGTRPRNEDFVGMILPQGEELSVKGILAAVADGVSGHGGGREAAEYTVRGLLTDYYAAPDTWDAPMAIDRVANAINRWVIAQGHAHAEWRGMATTLTALVLRGRRYTVAHAGDTRCYLLRDGHLSQLTTDHVWDRPEMQHVLTRGIGIDERLHLDFIDGDAQEGDLFLLLSDGIWEPLRDTGLKALALEHADPQALAQALADMALSRGSRDNCTALALRIDSLPATDGADVSAASRALPALDKLKPGQHIDGFTVLNVLAESRATLLYTARDDTSGQTVVLKTLQPQLARDHEVREAFAHEEWLARRIIAPQFPQYIPLAAGRRTALYFVMSWHRGETWQQQLESGRHFSVPEVVQGGIALLRGLGALHRLAVLHRDIKPANVHIGAGGALRILDFGVASCDATLGNEPGARAGTPSYLAPELFSGGEPEARTDLYAAAVTLYHLLTRAYPYGEIEPFQNPRFGEPAPASRHRRELPVWLDNVLAKGVARDPRARFETAEEFILALERGELAPLPAQPRTPLAARDPALFWRGVAVASLVMNLLLLYLLLVR